MHGTALATTRTHVRHCPGCNGTAIARSRRQGMWGWPVLRLLHVRWFRCTDCWHRYRAFGK